MIENISCRFCSSRCGLQYNIENGALAKIAKAPCESSCPAGIDIPGYVRLTSAGKFDEAIVVIRDKVPFPGVLGYVCTHPCESKCQRTDTDEPISIRALKRVAFENDKGFWKQSRVIRVPTGKRVAVIGSGPAGLTAAYYLALFGHSVTVFEALPLPGGMMRVGMPDYRLPRQVLDEEVHEIEAIGVEIRTNSRIESLDDVFAQGFNAVFVSLGAHRGKPMNITGENLEGVLDGVDFLREANLGKAVPIGERVLVAGGGEVAMDAARSAVRLGAREVVVAYRRTAEEMPASVEYRKEALNEGVSIRYLEAPVAIGRTEDRLRVEFIRMRLGSIDESGRRRPEPIKGSEFFEPYDSMIKAVGEEPVVSPAYNLLMEKDGRIVVDRETLATSRKGVFAGGDVVTGPAAVVHAIAAGRQAASAIDRYCGYSGEIEKTISPGTFHIPSSSFGPVEGYRGRRPIDAARINDVSVEANRCFWCDLVTGNSAHPLSKGWSCRRGRAYTARRQMALFSSEDRTEKLD